MPHIDFRLDGDGALKDRQDRFERGDVHETEDFILTSLPDGMVSGKPSVGLYFDLPGGKGLFAQTSLALFLTAADMLRAKYGDPRR